MNNNKPGGDELNIDSIIDNKLSQYSGKVCDEDMLRTIIQEVLTDTVSVALSKEVNAAIDAKLKPLMEDMELAKSTMDILPDVLRSSLDTILRDAVVSNGIVPGDGDMQTMITPIMPQRGVMDITREEVYELKETIRDLRMQITSMLGLMTEMMHLFRESRNGI